jgi:hypothetical protein
VVALSVMMVCVTVSAAKQRSTKVAAMTLKRTAEKWADNTDDEFES